MFSSNEIGFAETNRFSEQIENIANFIRAICYVVESRESFVFVFQQLRWWPTVGGIRWRFG